jgi:hypothetical protein
MTRPLIIRRKWSQQVPGDKHTENNFKSVNLSLSYLLSTGAVWLSRWLKPHQPQIKLPDLSFARCLLFLPLFSFLDINLSIRCFSCAFSRVSAYSQH